MRRIRGKKKGLIEWEGHVFAENGIFGELNPLGSHMQFLHDVVAQRGSSCLVPWQRELDVNAFLDADKPSELLHETRLRETHPEVCLLTITMIYPKCKHSRTITMCRELRKHSSFLLNIPFLNSAYRHRPP